MNEQPAFPDMPNSPAPVSVFLNRLTDHFGMPAATLPILTEEFDPSEKANIQLALDAYIEQPGREAELIGISAEHKRHMSLGLADLLGVTTADEEAQSR